MSAETAWELHGAEALAWFLDAEPEAEIELEATLRAIEVTLGLDACLTLCSGLDELEDDGELGRKRLFLQIDGNVSDEDDWQLLVAVHERLLDWCEGQGRAHEDSFRQLSVVMVALSDGLSPAQLRVLAQSGATSVS